MSKRLLNVFTKVVAVTATAWLLMPLGAQAGGGSGGATEPTQILNNLELGDQSIKQAKIVAENIRTQLNTAATVIHGVQNLKTLPYQLFDELMGPSGMTVADLASLMNSVNRLKTAAESTQYLMRSRLREANGLQLSVGDYMKYEVKLAATKGGEYRTRVTQDLKAIDDLRARAAQLKLISEKIKSVNGNVEGLQLLNQQATLHAGELMEIKSALLSANADRNAEAAVKEDATATKVEILEATAAAARERAARNKATTYTFTDPWTKTWPGMEGAK